MDWLEIILSCVVTLLVMARIDYQAGIIIRNQQTIIDNQVKTGENLKKH